MAMVVAWVAWAVWICDQRFKRVRCLMFEESPAQAGFSFWAHPAGAHFAWPLKRLLT